MKAIIRRGLAVALSAVLLTGALSGCGSSYDPVKEVMGYPGSTVLFKVDGNDVTASDYFFWMAKNADYVASYYSAMGGAVDWTASIDGDGGATMDEYVKSESQNTAVVYSVVAEKAAAAGYEFTAEDKSDYDEQCAETKEQLGGEEAYQDYLKTMCLTDDLMLEMSKVGVVYSHMEAGLCADGGEYAPAEGELAQYADDNGLLCAKHILLLTKDMSTGQVLSDEQKAEKKAKAEELLAQLQAISDPEELKTKFDELMQANSEDSGLQSNPDGYVFGDGEMVQPFEDATKALAPGQISGIVESDFGYHIILRQDPADAPALREEWQAQKMDGVLEQWVEEAQIETTQTYDDLTTADFYEKLTAYRATLEDSADQTDPAQDPNAEDQGTGAGDGSTDGTDASQPAGDGTDAQPTDGGTDGTDADQPAE